MDNFLTPDQLPQLVDWVTDQRGRGRSINFTNGSFDLLHPGHLPVLRAGADWDGRACGARLVVAIDSDRRVAFYKGAGRPILSVEERAEMLLATRFVDLVVSFDSKSDLTKIILCVQPDRLVRGMEGNLQPQGKPHGWTLAKQLLWVETPELHTSGVIQRVLTAENPG